MNVLGKGMNVPRRTMNVSWTVMNVVRKWMNVARRGDECGEQEFELLLPVKLLDFCSS
jgi:hypothetical protein